MVVVVLVVVEIEVSQELTALGVGVAVLMPQADLASCYLDTRLKERLCLTE